MWLRCLRGKTEKHIRGPASVSPVAFFHSAPSVLVSPQVVKRRKLVFVRLIFALPFFFFVFFLLFPVPTVFSAIAKIKFNHRISLDHRVNETNCTNTTATMSLHEIQSDCSNFLGLIIRCIDMFAMLFNLHFDPD